MRRHAALLLAVVLAATAFSAREAAAITISTQQAPRVARPGETGVPMMTVTLQDGGLFTYDLKKLVFTNTTSGPGTAAQRNAEIASLRLYVDNGDGVFGSQDTPVGAVAPPGGQFTFNVTLTFGGLLSPPLILFAVGGAALTARDGDGLDLSIQSANDLTFQPAATAGGTFPQSPAGSFLVDGMVAAQITRTPVGPAILLAGTTRNLGLDVRLPANGYAVDRLRKLTVRNDDASTARPGIDITAMRAWADDGDGVFEPGSDPLLGTMPFTGDRWQLTGLDQAIPAQGLRVFFGFDLSDLAEEGRTVRLRLPGPPEPGVDVESGNDGPIDVSVINSNNLTVSAADRVTLSSVLLPASAARPGQTSVPLLQVTARNTYAGPHTLTALGVEQAIRGPGSLAERDAELDAVTLRADGDGDGVLDDPAVDPVLGIAFFAGGRASFTGLAWTLPPGASRHLFVTGDVALLRAADGDTLAARVAGAADVGFAEPTHVVASWPLDSRASAVVDGMVAAQAPEAGGAPVTLGANEGPVVALDLLVPRNGYASDVLQRLDLVNLGTAVAGDLAELRLWRDGGNGAFDAGAVDDVDLGAFAASGGGWSSPALSVPLGAAGARLFVAARAGAAPTDSATVRLAAPIGGITVASGNDGPIDEAIERKPTILLSNAPLLVAIETAPPASAVGQPVNVRMIVRNQGGEAVNAITPTPLSASGTGAFAPLAGPAPASFALAPGARDTFVWTTTSASPGEVVLSGRAAGTGAGSGQPRGSLPAASAPHKIFASVGALDLTPTLSLPLSVNRGQADVVPFTLTFSHAGAEGDPALRLRGLRIGLDDGTGAAVVPSTLVARVVVSRGGDQLLVKTAIEGTGGEIALPLTTPLVLEPKQGAAVAVRLDVLASTTVPAFRVSIADSAWIEAEDAASGAPAHVRLTSGGYPVRTAVARVVAGATDLRITVADSAGVRAGPGQDAVPLLGLDLENRGIDGITSDLRVFDLGVVLGDSAGAAVARMSDTIERLRVMTALQTIASRLVQPSDGSGPRLVLNPPLTLPVNTPVRLRIEADLAPGTLPGAFRLAVPDSTACDARDANSLTPVAVELVPDPASGGVLRIEAAADTALVAGTPRFPPATTVGATGVEAMRIRVIHPDAPPAARLRVDAITLHCRDEARRPVVPATWLDRVQVLWNGTPIAETPDPPASGGTVTIVLAGPTLDPGDTAEVTIVVDLAPAAPTGFLELMVFGDGLGAVDDNLGQPAAIVPAPGAELPLVSGLTRVDAPARDLEVDLESRMPAALAADGREATAGVLTLRNVAPAGSSAIQVTHVVLGDRERSPARFGAAVERVRALPAGAPAVEGIAQPGDSTVRIDFSSPLTLPAGGAAAAIELRFVSRPGAGGSLRLGLEARDIGVVQPPSAALQIRVGAAPGRTFPLWTETGTFGGLTLRETWSNFPNPFAAGRQTTTFAYFLDAPARVTLRVYAADGDLVVGLLDGAPRAAGLHQGDVWSGRNGAGATVRNGVYLAELVAAYDDGRRATVRRTVAVVR